MFTKEAFLSKDNSESDQTGKAEFINDICNHEKKTSNARLYSVIDIEGKQEAIDCSEIMQEFHDRRDNFDILTFPKNIHQSDQFELPQFDKRQEMEEIKDRDFKWCDSLFDSYQNKIFENVLNDPELFLQDHVNKSWENITGATDSSDLISSLALDNFEPHENIAHNVSDCDFKWNEEPEINSSFTSQMNENICGSSVFTIKDSTAVQMCGDFINCPNEFLELQASMICEDSTVSESKIAEVNSKLSDRSDYNLPSLSELPAPLPEVSEPSAAESESIYAEVHSIQKKRKNQSKNVCDKRRRVTRRRKSKNCSEMLDTFEHFQEVKSNKTPITTPVDENPNKHCSANLINNHNMLIRQEKISSHEVLDAPMLSAHTLQNKLEMKNKRNKSKRPRKKRKNKLQDSSHEEDYSDPEKHNLFDEDGYSKQSNQKDCKLNCKQIKNTDCNYDQNSSLSTNNLCLKNSDLIFRDTTNSIAEDITQKNFEAKNRETYNATKSFVNNSPLRMKINLLKKEVVYCGYKGKKSHLRGKGKRNYRRKKQIKVDKQPNGPSVQNNDCLVPEFQEEGANRQLVPASKRKYCRRNNKITRVKKNSSLSGKMESPYYNGYSLESNKITESIYKSLDCISNETNITTTPIISNITGKLSETDLSYVLTSERVLEDCVLTYNDILNLNEPERQDHNQGDNEIDCEKSVVCNKDNSSKFIHLSSGISDTSQFSDCDVSIEESDNTVYSECSLPDKEQYCDFGWSNVHSSELLKESDALAAAVRELQKSASVLEHVKDTLESKDLVIKSLTERLDKFESNRLYKILEKIISEVEQTSFDGMSSASAIVRILMSYAEEKNL
ncbi:Protein of unknown function [Gryllus bimaculatus]|nr:Protein of unknown function [Gryllus bimaculatus]